MRVLPVLRVVHAARGPVGHGHHGQRQAGHLHILVEVDVPAKYMQQGVQGLGFGV